MKHTHSTTTGIVATLAGTLIFAAPAAAQPAIDWFTIDCGGGTSSSGTISLSGTIGQPDAGPGVWGMTGGVYTLVGGFWPGIPRPCRADFNQSGTVTVADIFAFLSAWFAQSGQSGPGHTADFNGDNVVSVADIFAFLTAWFAGC